jgi:hypothetical protein
VAAIGLGLVLGMALLPGAADAAGRFHAPSQARGGPHRGPDAGQGVTGNRGSRSNVGLLAHGTAGRIFHERRAGDYRFHRDEFRPRYLPAVWFPYAEVRYVSPVVDAPPPSPGPPVIVYAAPIVYAEPAAPAGLPPVPAVPPMPTVIEYATGRYELRGDGVTSPHTWAWVPNPPSAPPQAEEVPTNPSGRVTASTIYRWTDERGTTYLTNRLDNVPPSHRSSEQEESDRSCAGAPH